MLNILLITVDCLRADRLGNMGRNHFLVPHISRLAKESVVFTKAFATGPRTAESFPGILASTYPLAFGGTLSLPTDCVTLAEVLKNAGFSTAAFHSNPFLSSSFGYGKGFELFWDSREKTPMTSKLGTQIMPRLNHESHLYRLLRKLLRSFEIEVGVSHYVQAEVVTAQAIDWLRQSESPFFLWVHYMDMHYPFSPPARCVRQVHVTAIGKQQRARLLVKAVDDPTSLTREEIQVLKDLYDAGLVYVDQNIGALLDVLKHLGALNNTVVVLTADHGEEFLEHNGFGHGANIHVLDEESKARIKLYDELLHVPLIARVPDLDIPPQEIPALVSLVDIGPTLVDLLWNGMVDRWQGTSLTPLLCGKTESIRDGVFSEYVVRNGTTDWPVVSYRTQKWKYIHDGTSERYELYDLTGDPAEVRNMYSADVSSVSMLQQKVREHLALAPSDTTTITEPDVAPEVVERLRGLGYIE